MKKNLLFSFLVLFASTGVFGQLHDAAFVEETTTLPVLDGDLTDAVWSGIEGHRSDSVIFIWSGNPSDAQNEGPFGENDTTASSFVWKAVWDSDNLYVAISVSDTNINRDDKGVATHQDDGFDLNVGFAGALSLITINVEPDEDTATFSGTKCCGYVDIDLTLRENDFIVYNKITTKGWDVEFALPWAVWDTIVTEETVVKFAPKYNDANGSILSDGKPQREEHFTWGCSRITQWNDIEGIAVIKFSESSENDILTFALTEQTGDAEINTTNHTVDIEVANGTNVSNLIASVTVSENAMVDTADVRDYSSPVTLTVTAEDGTDQAWIVTVTEEGENAINASLTNAVSVYPNPASKEINVDLSSLTGNISITMVDLTGKVVYHVTELESSVYTINNALTPGIYFMHITSNEKVPARKVVVN